jgi:hypothetical protein
MEIINKSLKARKTLTAFFFPFLAIVAMNSCNTKNSKVPSSSYNNDSLIEQAELFAQLHNDGLYLKCVK